MQCPERICDANPFGSRHRMPGARGRQSYSLTRVPSAHDCTPTFVESVSTSSKALLSAYLQ